MKNVAAALLFFTRLPLWRLKAFQISAEYFKQTINYWAIVGWLTGGVMAGVLWLTAQIFPMSVAVILAILSRLLLTGSLHEDGLADFLDGFGGGTNKVRILEIMKDSHIGTYGVVGLIFYFLLLYNLLANLSLSVACVSILMADPFCKLLASQMTRFLIYARTAETSKAKVVYDQMPAKALIVSSIAGLLPLFLMPNFYCFIVLLFPILIFFALVYLMKKKIDGYTGDCCGALFLLCELSFYIGAMFVNKIFSL